MGFIRTSCLPDALPGKSRPADRFPFPSLPFQRLQFISEGASKTFHPFPKVAKNFRDSGLIKGLRAVPAGKKFRSPTCGSSPKSGRPRRRVKQSIITTLITPLAFIALASSLPSSPAAQRAAQPSRTKHEHRSPTESRVCRDPQDLSQKHRPESRRRDNAGKRVREAFGAIMKG